MYEKFYELMTKKGVSTYRVAKDCQIPFSTFTKWKQGVATPKVDKLLKLANYFGVDIKELIC